MSDYEEVPTPRAAHFIDWSAFWAKDQNEAEWLLEDVLARGRGHSIYAKHGSMKSLFTLWCCLEVLRAGAVVIYADWEMGESDLYDRLTDMGCGPGTDLSRLHYLMIPAIPPLNTPEGGRELALLVDSVQADFPGRHVCVVIDTIGRAVVGEENANDTIQDFYRFTGLELKRRAMTWVRIDHAGWEGSHARGASAKGDDVDVVWKLARTEDGIKLTADKRRMGWVPEMVNFKLETEPVLRYDKAVGSWPLGTQEVATLLDTLKVPTEASARTCTTRLREAGVGRRAVVVQAAQRYRRMVDAAKEERWQGTGAVSDV